MQMNYSKNPVVMLVYNRPTETKLVFERIKQACPHILIVVADGPRDGLSMDQENCEKVRSLINSGIDWSCEFITNYSEKHLGCKLRVSSGLDWVFSQVESAIIIEDDCVPALSFFSYCNELLERFKHDERVMQICGTNVSPVTTDEEYSYYFSKFGPVWGWASWRRAWQYYDVDMKAWPQVVENKIYQNFWEFPGEAAFRLEMYEKVYQGQVDTWDLQWGFAKFLNSGLSVIPSKNLISNIGYGDSATHTKSKESPMANLKTEELEFPLKHYPYIHRCKSVDLDFHYKMTPEKFWNDQPIKKGC